MISYKLIETKFNNKTMISKLMNKRVSIQTTLTHNVQQNLITETSNKKIYYAYNNIITRVWVMGQMKNFTYAAVTVEMKSNVTEAAHYTTIAIVTGSIWTTLTCVITQRTKIERWFQSCHETPISGKRLNIDIGAAATCKTIGTLGTFKTSECDWIHVEAYEMQHQIQLNWKAYLTVKRLR